MESAAVPFVGHNLWAIVSCLTYFVLLIGIGVYAARFSSQGQENFLLGGRRMKTLVVGLSAVVSGRSSWLLLSVTGAAFLNGASAIWMVTGYTVVELVLFLTVARRLRRETAAAGDLTIPDYFASRFGDKSNMLRLLSALIIILFLVTYVGAQIKGGGKALGAGFALPPWIGILLTGVVVLVYTAVGGFLAVSLTDVLQAFMMLFALIGLPIYLVVSGLDGNPVIPGALTPATFDPTALSFGALLGALGIGLGSPGNPHILVRYMSIENEKKLVDAGILGFCWNAVMGISAVAIGIIGKAMYSLDQLPGQDKETIFPSLAGHLPPLVFGMVIAAVFAAIMSTADSQLLVATSAAIRDIYQKVLKKGSDVDDGLLVRLNRAMVVVFCLIGILIALFWNDYINTIVLLAWTGLGCSFGPPLMLGLYWKKTSRAGAFAGLIGGTVTTVFWGLTPALKQGIVHEIIPAFCVSVVATIVFSLASPKKGVQG